MSSIAEKVRKLLNQAENTDNEAEAAIFMDKVQKLATLHSIDLAMARHATIDKQKTTPVIRNVTIGKRGQRGLNTQVSLISGIASANDVQMNIAHNSTYVILFGFEEDIDVVEALYVSLLTQMVTASLAFKKTGEWKQDQVYKEGYYEHFDTVTGKKYSQAAYNRMSFREMRDLSLEERWVPGSYVPIAWLTARLDFQQAFASRVATRLSRAKLDAELAAMAAEEAAGPGTALVLANKAVEVRDFYKEKSTARGSYRGGRSGYSSSTSRSAGDSAGASARLGGSASGIGGGNRAIA